MSFSALDSELTGPLFATAEMRAVFSDSARISAMLRVEAALASAEAASGMVPKTLARAIAKLKPRDFDLAALGEKTADSGVVAIPFVKALEARLPEKLRGHLHKGATSQDLVDTALVLQMAEAFDLIAADLAAILAGLTALADRHRRTVCVGRTYGQHAAPITFGYVAGSWASGLAEVAADLPALRDKVLVASLGGPVGTQNGLDNLGMAVLVEMAAELRLRSSTTPWHTARGRMVATGSWLATMIGALAKMATDVTRLAATEIGEVAEPHVPGRGGSSALPHKRNPVSATVILAAHNAAAGHVVTLLNAMAAEHQRPAGLWQAEWHALPALFGLASGALREARRLATGLTVDEERMRANIDITRGLLFADAAASRLAGPLGRETAHKLVQKAADETRKSGRPLQEVLTADSGIPARLRKDVAAAFDLSPATRTAAAAADRAIRYARSVQRALEKG